MEHRTWAWSTFTIATIMVVVSLCHVNSSTVEEWCVDDVINYDSYQSALTHVNSSNIQQQQLQIIIDDTFARAGCQWLQETSSTNMTCSGCLDASDIFTHYFQLPPNSVLTEEQFYNVSLVMATFIYQLNSSCSVNNHIDWSTVTYSHFVDQLMTIPSTSENTLFSSDQLEWLLRRVSGSYFPGERAVTYEDTGRSADISTMCAVGNTKSFSSYDVIRATSPTSDQGLQENELGKMSSIFITKLLHGECITAVYEDLPVSADFMQSIYSTYGSTDSCSFATDGLERLLEDLGVTVDHDHDHDHEHEDDHLSQRRRRDVTSHVITSPQSVDDINTTCLTVEEMLMSFNIDETMVTRSDFHKLCPALIQQAAIGCKNAVAVTNSTTTTRPSAAEIYGYSTLAVFIICLMPLLGLVIVKFQHSSSYKYILVVMLGLAVGSLTGDAFLHLLPQALGIHGDHTDHEHSSSGITVEPFTWKMLVACLSVWMFFIVQICLQWISIKVDQRKVASGKDVQLSDFNSELGTSVPNTIVVSESTLDLPRKSSIGASSITSCTSLAHVHVSVAWMVTVGDAIHNFTDGLAIGASFSQGWSTGLSTSIAVVCHEIPHEFGDTAILLSAGWSPLKVAIFQLISQSTAFIGLYIGISVSETSSTAEEWILAVAAGLFLYVALADVIPEIIACFERYRPLPMFIASNTGIMLGFLAMVLLAVFEEKIVIG